MIKFVKKKEKSFIPFLFVLLLMFQIISLSTSEEILYQKNNKLNSSNDSIETINTLAVIYNTDDLTLLNSEISKDNPLYESYFIEKSQQKYKNLYCNNEVSDNAIELTLHLPESFKYKDLDQIALKSYLSNKSSLLQDEPYFSSIIDVSKAFNINPVLLFAITGQEQSFVPVDHVSASKIANNPYNVFCSWQSYNTDIIDSSEIACRTIIDLSKDRPDGIDPLIWINKKYSADQNWHYGVRSLYDEISESITK